MSGIIVMCAAVAIAMGVSDNLNHRGLLTASKPDITC